MQKSFPLFECLVKRAILLFVLGHFIYYLHPPPPIEGFCVYPYQKYLLLLKTPSEIKIKVPTHSPLGKKKEFKDTNIHAPSAQKLQVFKDPPSSDFSVFQWGRGVQILNGMVAHCVLFLLGAMHSNSTSIPPTPQNAPSKVHFRCFMCDHIFFNHCL